MSLFVRVQTNFWTHRKTLRLRSLIGEAAFWIPVRLWCYAAENQADGNFDKYSEEEIAILLGYPGNPQALLQALRDSGYMDGMEIHGWADHNGYHEVFAQRAKKAANARWEKEKTRKEKRGRGKEKRREDQASASNACGMLEAFEQFWQAYPLKVGKGKAVEAWEKRKCNSILPLILTKVRALKISEAWTKEGGRFIPHPTTWLNREGWHDELPRGNGHMPNEQIEVEVFEA